MFKKIRSLSLILILIPGSLFAQQYKTLQSYSPGNCGNCMMNKVAQRYTYSLADIPATFLNQDDQLREVFFANRISLPLFIEDIKSKYQIKVTFLSDSKDRQLKVMAGNTVLNSRLEIPYAKPMTVLFSIPAEEYLDGTFTFSLITLSGANVAISKLEILSTGSKKLIYKDLLAEQLESFTFTPDRLSPVPAVVADVVNPVISLNGSWNFSYKNQTGKILVPGEWEMQGYHVDPEEMASYRVDFQVPADWQGKRAKLRFDGVSSFCRVFVNDVLIGSHEGGFVIFELDASTALKPGNNKIEVKVASQTISDKLGCVSQYAAHTVGGILRKVRLIALPALNIGQLNTDVKFDASYDNAQLGIGYKVFNESPVPVDGTLSFVLLDREGKEVALSGNQTLNKVIQGNGILNSKLELKVMHPKQWDTEHPYLYTLVTRLMSKGKVLQLNRQKVGFRQIDLRGNLFFVNNHPIKLHGANRHDVAALTGRSISIAANLSDALAFRNANCNYIRTSHYPPAEEFLAACDSLGIFVEAEAAIVWATSEPDFLPWFMRANMENIRGNRNHPSVIMWSLANESRWSPLWDKVNKEVKKYDPGRPTSFHDNTWGSNNNGGSLADIRNYHYPGMGGPEIAGQFKDRPVLFGEYCHVQTYNRLEEVTDPYIRTDWGRMLHQMYEKMYLHESCLGGAIWAGIDDVFHKPDSTIVGYGPWGSLLDAWKREKPEYISVRKSYAPFVITNLNEAKPKDGKLVLYIQNRYNFANLNEGSITCTIGNLKQSVVANIPARSAGQLILSVPDDDASVMITYTDPRGFVAQEERLTFKVEHTQMPATANLAVKLKTFGDQLVVTRADQKYTFNKNTGLADNPILSSIALMVVPLNSDDGGAPGIAGNNYQRNIKPLLYQPEGNWKTTELSGLAEKDFVKVTLAGEYNHFKGAFIYTFLPDGTVEVAYNFKVSDSLKINPRQWGLAFELPVSYQFLNYSRKGYWTVYPNADIARTSGNIEANPVHLEYVEAPLKVPVGPWSADANDLGSRDFRSTKANIYHAALSNKAGAELAVYSDGSQSARCWIDGNKTRFLIAEYNGGGSDYFFASYYAMERRPLAIGSELKGVIHLRLTP